MKEYLKSFGYRVFSKLRLPQIMHKRVARNSLTILAYHAVLGSKLPVYDWCFLDKSSFREQIVYLKSHFNVVHLSEAIELVGNGSLDRPLAVITFDDGFRNNYDVAFPILLETGTRATIFLTTDLIGTDDTVWFCRINNALTETSKSSLKWNRCVFKLRNAKEKVEASDRIQMMLKKIPHGELLNQVRMIISLLGVDPDNLISVGSPYRMLDGYTIREMGQSGLIEFGAHSHTHAILSNLTVEDKEKEIVNSLTRVEQLTGSSCELFAYPNGRMQDYDNESIRILKSCGVRAAVTMIPGPNHKSTPIMELRRYGIGGGMNLANFKATAHHFMWKCKSFLEIGAHANEVEI